MTNNKLTLLVILSQVFLAISLAFVAYGNRVVNRVESETWYSYGVNNAVAYWRLGDASGPVTDENGSYDLTTITGSPTYGATGLLPNDSDDAMDWGAGAAAHLDSNLGITGYPVSFEFLFDGTANTGAFVFFGDKDVTNDWLSVQMRDSTTQYVSATTRDPVNSFVVTTGTETDANNGATHHVIAVFASATSRKVYLNGVEDSSSTTSVAFPAVDRFAIAKLMDFTADTAYNDVIDEVRVYDTEISSSEVTTLYNLYLNN